MLQCINIKKTDNPCSYKELLTQGFCPQVHNKGGGLFSLTKIKSSRCTITITITKL